MTTKEEMVSMSRAALHAVESVIAEATRIDEVAAACRRVGLVNMSAELVFTAATIREEMGKLVDLAKQFSEGVAFTPGD